MTATAATAWGSRNRPGCHSTTTSIAQCSFGAAMTVFPAKCWRPAGYPIPCGWAEYIRGNRLAITIGFLDNGPSSTHGRCRGESARSDEVFDCIPRQPEKRWPYMNTRQKIWTAFPLAVVGLACFGLGTLYQPAIR